jgi:hypothetical protein
MSNGIRTNQWRLEPHRFVTLQLFMPPVSEQRAIVKSVSQQTTQLDDTLLAAERTIALLKERRTALIAEAVTGKRDVPVTGMMCVLAGDLVETHDGASKESDLSMCKVTSKLTSGEVCE